jgi:glycosyltransferase involved in cell wall biosynthesis
MKKKMLFMLINMNIGGTEKALLNMINEIPKDKYDITIFMLEKYGSFLKLIPSEVKVKYFTGYQNIKDLLNKPPQLMSCHLLKKGKIIKAITFLLLHIVTKMLKDRRLYFKYLLRNYPILEEEYDAAVAYGGPMDFISYFVVKKIKAKKKIQWVHFDVTQIDFNKKFASKIYKKFDKIFVVSKEGKNKLTTILPKIKDKTERLLNIISADLVVKMAKEEDGFQDYFNGMRILTVGRLSKEKGQDLSIPILAKLKKDGLNVKWYCIGEGNARREYENLIKDFSIENDFILLGAKPNPYPFMKQCDIYVQASRHEGYCITLSEAKCFKKPIVTTNFTGASEQISHNKTGIIVNDEEQLYSAIKQLLNNEIFRTKFTKNLQNEIVDTTSEIEKFLKIVDNIV